ncbi:acyl-CoA synthetase [Plasmodium reichenowi]|uniref:Acyl-CoA synthetase n=1 Tax=Plasmodium reichenowi TaxID=5854 RepID=A0A151L305_PLARE|nr:acyl-CoA synthetase [Plasmodium reichenowi]KYN93311.1 acyl-CoA synthetase [Plasmodium reichenowi]
MCIVINIYIFVICLIYIRPNFSQITSEYEGYAEICEKPANENESSVYCMKDHKRKNSKYVYKHIVRMFFEKHTLNNNKIALIEHECGEPQNYMTYGNFFKKILSFSNSLNKHEVFNIPEKTYNEEMNNGKFKLLGLYGSNSINWLVADLGAMISGVTTLVMHSKFSIDVIVGILNETKLEWLCLDLDLVEGLMARRNELPHLKNLIILDTIAKQGIINSNNEKEKKKCNLKTNGNLYNEKGSELSKISEDIRLSPSECDKIKLQMFNALKEKFHNYVEKILLFDDMTNSENTKFNIINEDPNFIASIVYTSGTSGKPKGVMLSNKNLFNELYSLFNHSIRERYSFQYHLSYLPISHVYERTFSYCIILFGGTLNIWSKDLSYFSKDIFNSKDFIMGGVPKVFSRIYTNIMTEINNLPPIKRSIVKKVISLRKSNKNGWLDKFLESIFHVSHKIKEKINPNLEIILNGGGKLSGDVAKELCTLLNINYCQGYGLTETAGAIFGTNEGDSDFESIGGPISPSTKYKVRSWEKYKATDTLPKGELLIKSDSIFKGYFLEKEDTKRCFTHDDYFITGDVVQINKNGSLTFLDRSKGLVKLSQGEYIETDLLNNLYSQISFINSCVVYGDDSMDGPLAIISVDKSLFFKSLKDDNMLEQCGVSENNYVDKLTDDNINKNIFVDYVKEKMLEVYKETNLNRYNIINHIFITSKTWDTNNYLTPTFKVKRFNVFKEYAFFIDEVKEIYKNKLKGTTRSSSINDKIVEKKDGKNSKETFPNSEHNNLHKSKRMYPENKLEKMEEITENKKVKLRATNLTQEKEQNN